MKNIVFAIRSLLRKGRHNVMKIVSLGVGLAVGLVLIAKVCFERSYDNFYPDSDRVYRVLTLITEDGSSNENGNTSGGIPIGLRDMVPEIEAATRYTGFSNGPFTMTDTRSKLKAAFALADSSLFDVLPRPMLAGDAKECLSRPLYAIVSDELAERIGGDVVGKTFTFDSNEDVPITIGGVFKAYPENSTVAMDAYISLPSIKTLWGYDGSMNYIGNDRYQSYIKLRPEADIASVEARMHDFLDKYRPKELRDKLPYEITYFFRPLEQIHAGDSDVKRMGYMLSLIGIALLFTAVMNYLLIVVSGLVGRAKEMAVRKSYGASERNIYSLIFSEAFVHLLLAVAMALLLLLAFRETVIRMVGTSPEVLLVSGGAMLLVVCLLVLLVTGLVPGSLFARIPVAAAFRNYRESRRSWKLGLLFVQFAAAAFLVTLLLVVHLQYDKMVNDDPGYDYDELAVAYLEAIPDTTRRLAIAEELRRLPDVAGVTTCTSVPLFGMGGNNISLPDDDRTLLNVSDLYYADANFLEVMGVRVIEGTAFNPSLAADEEVMLSREAAERLRKVAGWGDESVVGKYICETAHHEPDDPVRQARICGVYENFRVGTSDYASLATPSTLYYNPVPSSWLYVRFHRLTPEAVKRVEAVIASIAPDKDISLWSYDQQLEFAQRDTRHFRDAVLAGGIVTLLIVFIGLVGYTADEVSRRRKEMAIRKINGATSGEVIALFLRDVARVALPAILMGCLISFVVARIWQQQYVEKASLAWYLFLAGGVAVLAVIAAVSIYNVYKAARENPALSIKTE